MPNWNWQDLLQELNDAILTDPLVGDFSLSPEIIEKGWIGYAPATEAQIAAAEARLGLTLPPSYREFLQVSNGWPVCNPWMDEVFPVEKIDFLRNTDPDLIQNWEASRKDAEKANVADIAHTIQISKWTDMAVLLLNPNKSSPDGEWEAWDYNENMPGARVFTSFWDLMQDQLEGQIHASESSEVSPPQPKPTEQDQHKVLIDDIEHIRQSWLATPEYDPIQGEIDELYVRIRALSVADQDAFRAGLQEILNELKGTSSTRDTAQNLLTNYINSDVSTKTIDYARRFANLMIGTVIEDYLNPRY